MKIEHVALFVHDLEVVKDFYLNYFECSANDKYVNNRTGFSSYFLTFRSGARIELMNRNDVNGHANGRLGYHHIAISLNNKEEVVALTNRITEDGHKIVSAPRTTGDGYFESVIEDPEGNHIELTCPQ
jgi:lactoylglutathione lyase